jgi:hypothetical protein
MGADIHGVWECKLPNGQWVAFKEINLIRNYSWFGIISGVRGDGPRCESIEWDPRRERDAGEYWLTTCEHAGYHGHTLVSIPALREANVEFRRLQADWSPEDHQLNDWEPEPDLDEIVDELRLGARVDETSYFPVMYPNSLRMGVPLRDVLGLGPGATIEDAFGLLRMVVAYDS